MIFFGLEYLHKTFFIRKYSAKINHKFKIGK